ncbi:hypothetical protein [Saccharopolyspora spinosa]|uniref:hypothetical protein n=1 Tax=Saccharopolyspora spinosa TaxID=60894 RepID=UPI003BA8FCA2
MPHRLCGLSLADAVSPMWYQGGAAAVREFAARATAEALAVALQRHGLMSSNVAETLAHHAEQLTHLLESGLAEPTWAGVLRRAAG